MFWKNWIHAKKQIGMGSNYGSKKDARTKWNKLFGKQSYEELKVTSDKAIDFALEVYGEILESDQSNKQPIYYNFRNMYPQKFLENRGWENE